MNDLDVPGNAMASAAQTARLLQDWGAALAYLERAVAAARASDEFHVKGVSIRWQTGASEEYLLTIRGEGPDGPVVAFNSAYTLGELWRTTYHRFVQGKLKWKKDEYATR